MPARRSSEDCLARPWPSKRSGDPTSWNSDLQDVLKESSAARSFAAGPFA
ncbi:uncharacterized protein RCO7_15109 [Rhynchosporium graminicola]|uniref:Uncharacterized protein n=1 Tax=Rhynchosporium graminicola TaxID=2792576 RepID=A0A1E1LKN2_9HELO|nr:uncharacterized protein RCO7_15109 [Rhynchosporium commune]